MIRDLSIESAKSYKQAIEIIPNEECQQGLYFLRRTLLDIQRDIGPVAPIWLKRGGQLVGDFVRGDLFDNYIWMSHTGPQNTYLPKPICHKEPNYKLIVEEGRTKTVVLVDNVVESQGSFTEARTVILNGLVQYASERAVDTVSPDFYYLALVSKIAGDSLPNLTPAFWVNPQIWVHGLECDDEQKGRGKNAIWGRLKPNPDYTPDPPYYQKLFQ